MSGLLAATGFVYVSYPGVTKIASVAEEIEDPGRNIPLGTLDSLAFTTVLYVLVVTVIVGAAPTAELAGSVTPVANVAGSTLVEWGVLIIVIAAILALISTANAGLLSSSRDPFAMSRDQLAPKALQHVSDRFDTPTTAITLTGGVMLAMIAFVPIDDIATLGSAFKILVFILTNVALVAFREGDLDDYDPAFRDPFYPWTQAVGVVGGHAAAYPDGHGAARGSGRDSIDRPGLVPRLRAGARPTRGGGPSGNARGGQPAPRGANGEYIHGGNGSPGRDGGPWARDNAPP